MVLLTHWGRVTHIYVSNLPIIGSNNALSPGRRQAIIWTNAGISLIRTLGTNFSQFLNAIHALSFKRMHLKMSSAKWCLFRLGLNELRNKKLLYIIKLLTQYGIINSITLKCLNPGPWAQFNIRILAYDRHLSTVGFASYTTGKITSLMKTRKIVQGNKPLPCSIVDHYLWCIHYASMN